MPGPAVQGRRGHPLRYSRPRGGAAIMAGIMMYRRAAFLAVALLVFGAAGVAGASPTGSALNLFGGSKRVPFIRPVQKDIPTAGVTQVVLQNLVGPIRIQTTQGTDRDDMKLVVLIHAAGQDETFARTLSEQLTFSVDQIGNQVRIIGHYPLDHFRDYGYPRMKSIMWIHGTDAN